jgi:hypothetical protein
MTVHERRLDVERRRELPKQTATLEILLSSEQAPSTAQQQHDEAQHRDRERLVKGFGVQLAPVRVRHGPVCIEQLERSE